MKRAIVFEASRDGYGIDQLRDVMTVGQLKRMLEDCDDDMMVICSHVNGYAYGSLSTMAEIREEVEGEYGTEYETVNEISASWW